MKFNFKVIQFPEILDNGKSIQFQEEIKRIIDAGVSIILIDFQGVNFISSSGLIALVEALKIVRKAGGKLFICSINEQIKMILELTNVEEFFEVFDNIHQLDETVLLK